MRLCALVLIAGLMTLSVAANASPAPDSFADVADRLLPAVVNISSTQKIAVDDQHMEVPTFPPGSPFEEFFDEFFKNRGQGGPNAPASSLGSGFVIDATKGYIVTNNHVIRDAEEIRVTLNNDTTLDAKVIGRDEKLDLAVIQVKPVAGMAAVRFGDSGRMRVGDWVIAIGNPFGLGGTVTAGIISARQRDISAGPYDDFIQTDASINRGNSGGPMFNVTGEVIGINTAIFSPSGGSVGIGFAIPSNLAKPVIDQLIAYGRTRRGWIGVRIQSVTDEIATSLGLDKARGALVADVTPGGPSEAAKLRQGDIILEFNGKPIVDMRTLPRLVAETEIGSVASLVVWRDGRSVNLSLKVDELEKAEKDGLIETASDDMDGPLDEGTAIAPLGISVATLSPAIRENYGLDTATQGVLVLAVDKGAEAIDKGLAEGDVIVEINQKPVSTPADVLASLADARANKRDFVLLLVNTQGRGDMRFVALRPAAPNGALDPSPKNDTLPQPKAATPE